jgi:hypothetical protein
MVLEKYMSMKGRQGGYIKIVPLITVYFTRACVRVRARVCFPAFTSQYSKNSFIFIYLFIQMQC